MTNDTDFRLPQGFVKLYAEKEQRDHPLKRSFNGLGYVVFKRTYARPIPEEGRSEEWHETVERVVNGAIAIGSGLTPDEAMELYDHIWNLRGSVGGRMLWQLGTENNDRLGADSLVNCWFVNLTTVEDFGWMFERLMLGGGVGFSVTRPEEFGVVRQGNVVHEEGAHDSDFIVPDKREGWADLLVRVLRAYLPKHEDDYAEFTYSTVLIRPEGAPIKTFGGVASGPGILVDGVVKIARILDGAVGRTLTSVELLDIANVIGAIVVSGNVRRSAQIALGNADDVEYLRAKRWDLGNIPSYRAMSNNSVFVRDFDEVAPELWDGYHGHGEPYGFVNLRASRKYGRAGEERLDTTVLGTNPCAEISLGHRESCNLAELFLPNIESEDQLFRVARLLYKVQKAVAAMPYLDPESNRITSQNMRLGLGVTGVAQAWDKVEWLDGTYNKLRGFDNIWSGANNWPTSVRLTTVKPSGTLSLLAGVTPGVHPGFSRWHIRRVRMASNDPVFEWAKQQGYPWEFVRDFEGNPDSRTVVIEFPASFPPYTLVADEVSAIDQLEMQAELQRVWADNAVSVTVYYRPEELAEIQTYLKENWRYIKSASFLPYSDHGFDQAPLEAISKDEYEQRLAAIEDRGHHVHGISGDLIDSDCATGACPIR